MILLILVLVFIYINIDIVILSVSSPYYIATILGGLLFVKNIKFVNCEFKLWLPFVALLTLSTIISFTKFGFNASQIQSLIQAIISILIGYACYVEIRKNHRKIPNIFEVLIWVIIALVVLEVFFMPFQLFSDGVRNIFYDSGIYKNDYRDLSQFGFIRPKLFSREPSFVTGFFTYLIIPYYCLSSNKQYAFHKSILFISIVLFLTASLKALVPLLIIVMLKYSHKLIQVNLRTIVYTILLIFSVVFAIIPLFGPRILNLLAGNELSGFIRINLPAILSYSTIIEDPLTGWGFANKEIIELNISIFIDRHLSWVSQNIEELANLNNYFFGTIIYFGLAGTIFAAWIITKLLKGLSMRTKLFCILIISILGFTQGGWITLKFWVRFYLIIASLNYFFRKNNI